MYRLALLILASANRASFATARTFTVLNACSFTIWYVQALLIRLLEAQKAIRANIDNVQSF